MDQTYSFTDWLDATLKLPPRPASRWYRAGITPRAERLFEFVSSGLLLLFAVGWTWAIVHTRAVSDDAATPATSAIAAGLTSSDAPSAAYLTDAALTALTPLRGESGKLRATIRPAGSPLPVDSLPAGATVTYASGADSLAGATLPQRSGIWRLALHVGSVLRPVSDFNVITMVPFSAKRNGRVGLYFIGNWPTEGARTARPNYAPPLGFIEVTPENEDTRLSEHFRLRDFLTHDQQGVWPKYLVIQPKLVDKLELVLQDLQEHGINPAGVHVMSGFRTPQYNYTGGNTGGRANLSRHMYGDASDIFIDNDGDGSMDDLNHDGKRDINDARVILEAVERVERAHPELIGGAGVYVPCCGHGPFIHIDTRGYRARWTGTGGG